MRRGLSIATFVAMFVVFFSQAAWAQTTGSIRGRCVDSAGLPLPGATVEVTGDLLGTARRAAVTSTTGGFQFAAMPIGAYTVTASLSGFQTQAVENLRVSLGAVASIEFAMPEAFSDEITVLAEAPIVDVSSPTFNTRFEAEQIIDLPTRGNFYDMIALTPGVNQISEGGSWVAAFGADVKSSQWNIDGLRRNAPEGGDLAWSMNDEMVAEIQVLGTGATAQYGGMSGTAFNVVTKSGTNQFHGSASLDWWNPGWVDENARREDYPEGAQTYELDHHNNLAMTLGGPILKDKVWFFLGAEWGRFQAFWPGQDSTLPMQKESTWDNYDGKLTAQISQNHRLNLLINDHDYLGPSAGWINAEPSYWDESWDHNTMIALDYTAVLGENTLLEARGGIMRNDHAYRSQYPNGEVSFVDYFNSYPEFYYGDLWWSWDWEEYKDDAEVIITQHADQFIKGDHEFKFGVQYSRGGGNTKPFNPTRYELWYYDDYYYPDGLLYLYTGLPYYYGGESESIGFFATDSWSVGPSLTLDIGARYDSHKGWVPDFNRLDMDSNPTGEVIDGRDTVDWDNIDPRFGFAWQPGGDGRSVLRGSIGLFHAGMTSGDWYSPPPEVPEWSWYYQDWEGNWQLWDSFGAADVSIIPGTENASTWEYTLGFDHQLNSTSAIGVQAVYKESTNNIGWYIEDDGAYDEFIYVDPETGNEFRLRDYYEEPTRRKGNSTGPGAVGGDRPYEQNYMGFFLTYKKRLSNNWDLMASYSYSKAEGLNPRFITTDWSGQGQVLYANRDEAEPNAHLNSDKVLGGDRRHALRVVGNVMLPYDFRINSVILIQSGRVYDRVQRISLPNRPGSIDVITQPATDDQRLPTQYLWDFGIGKHFSLGEGTDFSIYLQILNLLNDDAVDSWRDTRWPVGEEPLPGSWVLPRRAQLRARFTF